MRHLTAGAYATTAQGEDPYACAQDAVRRMIDRLVADHDLSPEQAYCLCSVAGDLEISQVVMSRKVVNFSLPRSVLAA